jgi:hypothetical protein
MKITRISCMEDGASAFDEIEVELTSAGTIGSLSKPHPVTSVVFRETPPEYDFDWHPAPILLLEDTWGSGHRTRTTNGKLCRSIFIRLDA